MTTQDERLKYIEYTEEFLKALCILGYGYYGSDLGTIPRHIQEIARGLLRHYPSKTEVDIYFKEKDMK